MNTDSCGRTAVHLFVKHFFHGSLNRNTAEPELDGAESVFNRSIRIRSVITVYCAKLSAEISETVI